MTISAQIESYNPKKPLTAKHIHVIDQLESMLAEGIPKQTMSADMVCFGIPSASIDSSWSMT